MDYKNYLSQFLNITEKVIVFDNNYNEIDFSEASEKFFSALLKVRNNKKHVYLIGNGGSNAIVSHVSVDLLKSCHIKATAITDSSILTCYANDYGYPNVFSESLKKLMNNEDLLISVSSSGQSENIINALDIAKKIEGVEIITFSAFSKDNKSVKRGNLNFWLDTNDYGFAEIGHALLLHYFTDKFQLI